MRCSLLIFNHYFYSVKINQVQWIPIKRTRFQSQYYVNSGNNIHLISLISMNAVCLKIKVEKALNWIIIKEPQSLAVTGSAFRNSCAAVTNTIFHVVSPRKGNNKFVIRVLQSIIWSSSRYKFRGETDLNSIYLRFIAKQSKPCFTVSSFPASAASNNPPPLSSWMTSRALFRMVRIACRVFTEIAMPGCSRWSIPVKKSTQEAKVRVCL